MTPATKVQVSASGAQWLLGDLKLAQLLLGTTVAVPVVPACQVPPRGHDWEPIMTNGHPYRRRRDVLSIAELLRQLDDEPVRGGCDRCDAFSIIDEVSPGFLSLVVAHDDWCSFYRSRQAASN